MTAARRGGGKAGESVAHLLRAALCLAMFAAGAARTAAAVPVGPTEAAATAASAPAGARPAADPGAAQVPGQGAPPGTSPAPQQAVSAGALVPHAMIDENLVIGGDSIAAREERTRLSVPVLVNGSGPFRFIVDSGADRSVIGTEVAARLALPTGGTVTLFSMAGPSQVRTVSIATLEVGGSTMSDVAAPALPEMHLGAHGILGIDALADQRLMLDFEKRAIVVQNARRPVPVPAGDEIVVVARKHRGQLIITQASAGGHRLQAIIDTGAELTVGNGALRARLFGGRRPPVAQPVALTSVTGQVLEATLVTLPELKIGSMRLRRVPVAFVDAPPFQLFGLTEQPAILLGTDVLQAFARVSLDFGRRRVRFQMRR